MSGCHLVQDIHLGEIVVFTILDSQSQTLDRIVDIDEGSSLLSSSINSKRMSASDLRAEPVEHCTEVAVNVDSVAQIDMHFCLRGTDSPNDSLVKLRDL